MAFVHGRNTYIALSGLTTPVTGADLSPYTKTSEFSDEADIHDTTTYGKNSKTKKGGLVDRTFKASGVYDSSTTAGPRAVLEVNIGVSCTLTRRSEGTGTGKPQRSVAVVISKYTETNPVDDMIAWAAEFECSDDPTDTTQ